MLKLILKVSLISGLTWWFPPSFRPFLFRNYYSTSELPAANKTLTPWGQGSNKNLSPKLSEKTLNSLNPIKIYTSLNHSAKKTKMLNDLTGQGGIVLFLAKKTSLYAIEGSCNLTGYLKDFFNKEMLKLLADIKVPKAIQKKTKIQLKTHYQELLHQDWKDYDLYLLESWDSNKDLDLKKRLVHYHTKYQPKLNLFRYVSLANGEIEEVYQWNRFKTEEQLLTASKKKSSLKALLTYRIDSKSPLDKLKGKVWYENKNKAGIYRWVNRINKQSFIGCSLNLGSILYSLQLDKITVNSKDQLLNQAFQEYGLTSFNLQVLVHCCPEELAEKEQYYLNLYQSKYNRLEDKKEDKPIIDISITKSPASLSAINTLGKQLVLFESAITQLTKINQPPTLSLTKLETKFIEDKEHLKNISLGSKGREICKASLKEPILREAVKPKKWTLSEATRLKQSLARRQREKQPNPGFKIKVWDLVENQTIIYSSCWETAQALNINKQAISNYLINKQTKPYKKRYIFTKL